MVVNFSPQQVGQNDGIEEEKQKVPLMEKLNNYVMKLSKVPVKEKLFFVQHLSIMLKSGISLAIALKTLSVQTENKYFSTILNEIAGEVEKGKTFSESLSPYSKVFGELFINMIEAGELSGKLEAVLGELFTQMKKEHKLISKVKGALTYPAVICIAMFGIGTFMIVVIIPKMTSMFTELGTELPLPTKILIGISDVLIKHGIISVLVFVTLIFSIVKILKTEKGLYLFQSFLLNMPIISPIVKKMNLARFARNISSLLKTDIMIIKSFQITANVISNLHYRKIINEMSQKIKKGGKISEIIASYPKLFPPIVTQMVAVGEETGELDNILVELAEFYEEEIDQIMENLPSLIEPLLILAMGVGIGGIAIAILMPMYSIGNAI